LAPQNDGNSVQSNGIVDALLHSSPFLRKWTALGKRARARAHGEKYLPPHLRQSDGATECRCQIVFALFRRQRRERGKRSAEKRGVIKRRDRCTRAFTSRARKQCVKPCMCRGSFRENANLFRRGSHEGSPAVCRAEMTFNSSRCPLAFDRFKRSLRTRLCAKARERHRGKRLLAHVNFAKLQPAELARPRRSRAKPSEAERSLGVPGVHRSQRSAHDPVIRSSGRRVINPKSGRALIAARSRDIDQYLRQTHKYPDATLKAVPGEGRYSRQCTCSDRVARNVPIWASPKLSTGEEKREGSRRRAREGESSRSTMASRWGGVCYK